MKRSHQDDHAAQQQKYAQSRPVPGAKIGPPDLQVQLLNPLLDCRVVRLFGQLRLQQLNFHRTPGIRAPCLNQVDQQDDHHHQAVGEGHAGSPYGRPVIRVPQVWASIACGQFFDHQSPPYLAAITYAALGAAIDGALAAPRIAVIGHSYWACASRRACSTGQLE